VRRASIERARTLRVWRAHLGLIHSDGIPNCFCEFQPGRFRKGQRIAGCDRSRCHLCHPDKLLGIPTAQQHRADLSMHEWLRELGRASRRPRRPW
jgi:hypothetical protein